MQIFTLLQNMHAKIKYCISLKWQNRAVIIDTERYQYSEKAGFKIVCEE